MANKYFQFRKSSCFFYCSDAFQRILSIFFYPTFVCVLPKINLVLGIVFSYGPRQANLVLIAYASSEGSSEPAHPRSLARTFAARSYKQ